MNKWGWGDWSAITSVKASTWPDVVDQPTTSIDPASGAVWIKWLEPNFYSSKITRYIVEIQS